MKNLYFFLCILVLFLSCKEKPASGKTDSDKKTAFEETQKNLSLKLLLTYIIILTLKQEHLQS